MGDADIDWIPAGTRFTRDDMVHFQGKGERPLEEALPSIDLVITGPHASAALPEEVAGFVEPRFTKRLQYDFTDVSTSPVAKAWAAIDPHVLYIEDPHPRAVRDANRARPADLESTLREAFDRLAAEPEGTPSLAGVDAIRPVTFAYLPVYRRPRDDAEWRELIDALTGAGAGGIDEYERVRDQLIEQVVEAKLRRLATLDPSATTVAEWHSAQSLDVLSLHDTMNHTARPDGAICVERAPADRLPNVVALSNRGEPDGSTLIREEAGLRDPVDLPTMRPPRLRAIAAAYRQVFDAHGPDDVVFNRPYLGGYETQLAGPRLRALEDLAVVRVDRGPTRRLRLGAFQNEFLREFLLGEEAAAELMAPGTGWTLPPDDRVQWLAERLSTAHGIVRSQATRAGRGGRM